MRPPALRLAVLVALAALLACARPSSEGPVPLSIVPALGTGLTPLSVEVAGRNLDAWVRSDFSSATAGSLDGRYTASLDPVAGGTAVALQEVVLTPRRTLRATIPAGLARGAYRLVLSDPRGRVGVLEQAFRVVSSVEAAAGFRVELLEPPRAGVPFAVAVTAVDAVGNVVDGFAGSVSLSDQTGTLSAGPPGPFANGTAIVRALVPAPSAGDRLTATDPAARGGTSALFDVIAGPPSAVVFAQQPVAAAAGACSPAVALEVRDVLGHLARADRDVPTVLQSAPPDLRFFSDAACASPLTSVTIAAGATGASFHFVAPTAGTVTLRAVPASLPSAAQDVTVSP